MLTMSYISFRHGKYFLTAVAYLWSWSNTSLQLLTETRFMLFYYVLMGADPYLLLFFPYIHSFFHSHFSPPLPPLLSLFVLSGFWEVLKLSKWAACSDAFWAESLAPGMHAIMMYCWLVLSYEYTFVNTTQHVFGVHVSLVPFMLVYCDWSWVACLCA